MASRTSSSRLVSHLLAASKSSPAHSSPKAFSLRPKSHTSALIRNLSSSRLLRQENTAPSSSSQSSASNPTKTTQTPTGSTQQSSSASPSAPTLPPRKIYTFTTLSALLSRPPPNTILIDVREPSELASTGHIPSALNLPLKSSPDFPFLSPEEFEDRFGRPRPTQEDEVIFYCKSGVRSKAAAELAQRAGFGGRVSEYPGSWGDWAEKGGEVER